MGSSERTFTLSDQLWFGAVSGDRNPIHVDPDWAAVNFPGEIVVHGAFALLWAIDCAAKLVPDAVIGQINVTFVQPILIGDCVRLDVDRSASLLRLFVQDHLMMVARIGPGSAGPPDLDAVTPAQDPALPLASRAFADLKGLKGSIPTAVDQTALAAAFPMAVSAMGPRMAAGLARISGLVGMECPGHRSMSSEYSVEAAPDVAPERLDYEVTRTDRRFCRVEMSVAGSGLRGSLSAYRGQEEAEPSTEEIARSVLPGSFAGAEPLIIGGSHGLGAAAARLLAAGGARPWITWQRSPTSAERVGDLILAGGGACHMSPFDTEHADAGFAALANGGWAGKQIYYFATPRIVRRRLDGDRASDLASFRSVYIDQFATFAKGLRQMRGAASLSVFYPSDEAVIQPTAPLTEYAKAKLEGELLCEQLAATDPDLEIIVGRVQRARTRQMQVIGLPDGVSAHEAILPWLARVQGR